MRQEVQEKGVGKIQGGERVGVKRENEEKENKSNNRQSSVSQLIKTWEEG